MEWQLPIQKVEISNINIANPWVRGDRSYSQKPMAPLSYHGTQFRMPFITILFPPLPIEDYNPNSGRLVLDMSSSNLACIKLNTLQETIINSIHYNQQAWFRSEYSKEDVRDGFQPIIEPGGHSIILHCPVGMKNIPVYNNGWKSFSSDELKPGLRIRVSIKIHGISFLTSSSSKEVIWSGKCRLQHKIQGIIFQNN